MMNAEPGTRYSPSRPVTRSSSFIIHHSSFIIPRALVGELQKFSRNSFFLAISYFLRFSSGLLLTVLVGKSVTEDDFGRLSLALTISTFFGVVADFGLPQLTIRDVAQDHSIAARYYRNVLTLKTVFSLICFLGVIAFVHLMKYPAETRAVIYPIAIFTFIASIGSYHYFLFRGLEQMQFEAASASVHNLLLIACVLPVLFVSEAPVLIWKVSYGYLAAGIISTVVIIVLFGRKAGGARFSFKLAEWKTLLGRSGYFALYGFLGLIYISSDTVMISKLWKDDPEREVAFYQAPVKLLMASIFIIGIVTNVFLPMLSRKFKGPVDDFKSVVRTLNRVGITLIAPITMFSLFFSLEIMAFVFKASYGQSSNVLKVLSLAFLAWYAPPYGIVFSAMEKQHINFWVSAACAVFNVVLNLVFIPRYGAIAAASTTLATYVLMRACYAWHCRRYLGETFVDLKCVTTVLVCAVIAAALKLTGLHVMAAAVLFCIVYVPALYLLILAPPERELCLKVTGGIRERMAALRAR